jgi:hypothetical protein
VIGGSLGGLVFIAGIVVLAIFLRKKKIESQE